MADTAGTAEASTAPPQDSPAPEERQDGQAEDGRDTWSGRCTFWLAAVGSAVGLGNLWRFPWQCNKWGAGAFIFAYFVALLTLGMPLLTQELVLGQKHRSGDIEAFGRMNWRLRGIGLASVVGAFGIVTYYMMIIGISMVFFFESFMVPMPWEGDNDDGANYWTEVLDLAPSIVDSKPTVSWKLFLATAFCWVITFICIRKGVKTASWAVKITMPLPFILLLILLIQAATMDGAGDGVSRYLDFSNWDALSDNGIWQAAIGQCFFSLSVCMGVMTAFGSYNPIKQDIATDEKVIAFLDVGASIISGFVVYCILGFLVYDCNDRPDQFMDVTWADAGSICVANTTTTFPGYDLINCPDNECAADQLCAVNTDLCESWYAQASFGLVFSAFPVAIAQFDGANVFAVLFFATLVMLGIDSAFSITEAICTVVYDADVNTYRWKLSKQTISGIACVSGCIGSLLFCFDTGMYWLDIVDFYINNYGMVLLGVMESSACGWFYGYDRIEAKLGKEACLIYRVGFWSSLMFGSVLSFCLSTPEGEEGSVTFTGGLGADAWIPGFLIGMAGWGGSAYYAFTKISDEGKALPMGEQLWLLLGWENVEILRDFMNSNGVGEEQWATMRHTTAGEMRAGVHHSTIGIWWGFFVKYWIPIILTIVLISSLKENSYNPYGGYEWSQLMVGILIFSSMIIIVVLVAIFPQYMTQKADEAAADAEKKAQAELQAADAEGAGDENVELNKVTSTSDAQAEAAETGDEPAASAPDEPAAEEPAAEEHVE